MLLNQGTCLSALLPLSPTTRYSIIVLIVECIGISAVIPYGVINVCHTHPSGSPGLPVDDGTLSPDKT